MPNGMSFMRDLFYVYLYTIEKRNRLTNLRKYNILVYIFTQRMEDEIMSCHDIGRGMNSVVDKVIEMYDEGELTVEAARKIIAKARKGVHWCDGNEGEAVASIRRCRCGRCLKEVPSGTPLYSVWDISVSKNIIDKNPDEILASDGLCLECFDIVLNFAFDNEGAGERERNFIEEHYEPEDWQAE